MATVRRYDRAELSRPIKTDAGFIRGEAYLTRAGIFEYVQPDGSVRRELRPPEEVFRDDSLDTLKAVPLTLDHPAEAVTVKNVKELAVGTIGTDIFPDYNYVRGTVVIMDEAAIEAAESGAKRELSCGYNCDLEIQSGEWEGQRFDAIQRNIRYNHVALVEAGRAGPEVGLRLDSADAVATTVHRADSRDTRPDPGRKEKPMAVIRIDRIDYEAPEQTAQAVRVKLDEMEAEKKDIEAEKKKLDEELEKLKAQRDQLQEELEKKQAEDEAKEKERADSLREAVRARVALESQARAMLGDEVKLDEMDDLEVKKAVVSKVFPAAKLDGKSDVYLEARYDAALELHKSAPNEALGNLRARIDSATSGGGVSTSQERRDAMLAKARDAWKQPIMPRKGA